MSEKDRFEMNDDMAFDSDTDGPNQNDDFEDPLDGFRRDVERRVPEELVVAELKEPTI